MSPGDRAFGPRTTVHPGRCEAVLGGPYEYRGVLVVDADTDELVYVPVPVEHRWELQALADDGTQLLLTTYRRELCLQTLATGHQRYFPKAVASGPHRVRGRRKARSPGRRTAG